MDANLKHWHTLSAEETLEALKTKEKGLSYAEASFRQKQYGYNLLPKPKPPSAIVRFLAQFQHVLIYILLTAVLITLFLGEWLNAIVISAVILIDAVIGFFQEGKAEEAIRGVTQLLPLQSTVVREQKCEVIPAEELVPGDVVLLQSGDKVPADLRLISADNLLISEMILTGESSSVEKQLKILPVTTSVNDRTNMAFSGTLVASGRGVGVVVGTGIHTEIGRITQLLEDVERPTTPLLRKINRFSYGLSLGILCLVALLFLMGIFFWNYSLESMLMVSVGIAVSAIPEGLPIILTVTLAIGVRRMALRNAIVRRLPAVETLGSVTVICTDKTGTLTCNEMTIKQIFMMEQRLQVEGVGYVPFGKFYCGSYLVEPRENAVLAELCKAAMLCNEAEFIQKEPNQAELKGDPTEGALLVLAMKAGYSQERLRKDLPLTDIIPFESEQRLMATLHHDQQGNGVIYVKGAPEVILKYCSKNLREAGEESSIDKAFWERQIEEIARDGQRALALAFKLVSSKQRALSFEQLDYDFILLGVVGIIDPPREEALLAIRECQSAGIRVKMITGDHATTARVVASQMGIGNGEQVLTGEDLEKLDEAQFLRKADQVDVFARTTATQKLKLVKALQQKENVVAMTGDGVNDAPALKCAEIGVAMGLKGSDAAKEASEIVLADDNFASIVAAVQEGRTVFNNLKKVILFALPINAGEVGSLVVAILLGYTLPITPLQILWVNMVSSVILTMALAFEPSDPDVMKQKATAKSQAIELKFLVWRVFLVGMLFVAGIFAAFEWGRQNHLGIEIARTLAVNTLVGLEIFALLSIRYNRLTLSLAGIKQITRAVIMAILTVCLFQFLFTYAPFMQWLFKTSALNLSQLGLVLLIGMIGFVVLEIDKWISNRLR